jgi:hypothetical protein
VREKFAHKEKKMAKKTWLRGAALALIAALALAGCSKANAQAGGSSGSSGGSSASSAVKEAPESDFTVELTKDSTGVVITKYNGNAKTVRIPATIQGLPVREIGYECFRKNKTITSVIIPEGVTKIVHDAFTESSLTSINFPKTLTEIGYNAFAKCNVTAIDLSGISITRIASETFRDCTALTSVILPDSIKVIGPSVFHGCTALTTVTIPETVQKIDFADEKFVFLSCSKLPISTQAKLKELGYTGNF